MKITDRLIFLTKFLLKNFFIACTLSFLLILFYGDVNIFTDRHAMINSFRQMLLILFTSLIPLTIVISVFSYHITSTHSNVIEPVGKAIIKPAGKLLVNNERTAIHEAGHALLAFLFDFDCEVIMYKYPAYTSYNCNINIDLDLLKKQILITYAGIAAEEILLGNYTLSPVKSNNFDLVQVTDAIRAYILMSDNNAGKLVIDDEISDTMINYSKEFYQLSKSMLLQHIDKLKILSEKLKTVDSLSSKDIKRILT